MKVSEESESGGNELSEKSMRDIIYVGLCRLR